MQNCLVKKIRDIFYSLLVFVECHIFAFYTPYDFLWFVYSDSLLSLSIH